MKKNKLDTVLNNMSTALVVFCVVVVTIAIIILIGVVALILMVKKNFPINFELLDKSFS